jgi:predicted enzyme related to lactoylglutathione lyase
MATTNGPGKFVWFEYLTKDERKAQSFFGELFNWKTKEVPMPQGKYTMIALGNDTIGGFSTPPPGLPPQVHWLTHMQVTNVQEIVNKVKGNGGRILKEPYKVGDQGMMSIAIDPMGAVFALWQPTKVEGTGDYRGTDGSFVWNELYTDDPDKSLAFYKTIGGFTVERMTSPGSGPGPDRYDVLKSEGKSRAGVMKMAGVPPMWMPYVKVSNADQTVERAKKLGATFKHPAETIPNVGRLAVMMDPQGAPLGILQPSPM